MRVVVDTNVIVSGLLSPHGPPATVVSQVGSGVHCACFDGRILAEYREVLSRPRLALPQADVDLLLARLTGFGVRLSAPALRVTLPDEDGLPFLEVAVAAKAAYLITGNLRHFPKSRSPGIEVISPRDFVTATATG